MWCKLAVFIFMFVEAVSCCGSACFSSCCYLILGNLKFERYYQHDQSIWNMNLICFGKLVLILLCLLARLNDIIANNQIRKEYVWMCRLSFVFLGDCQELKQV